MCKYCEKTKIGLKEVFDGYSRRGLPKYKKVDNIDVTQLDTICDIDDYSTMYINIDTNTLIMHHKSNAYSYDFDVELNINYCPICGRKLK